MHEFTRREFMAMAAALPPLMQTGTPSQTNRLGTTSMFVCMHEASSAAYDFKTAMEGYAKAGVRAVEPDLGKVREFAMKESPAKARQLLDDLGLKAVSSSNQLNLMEPGDQRAASVEQLKWKVELAQVIGADRLVTPSAGTGNYKEDDYKKGIDNMREAAEIAKPYGVTLMLEFARTSRFIASLPTALKMVRDVNHPNYRVMMDTYHFWGGISKFEDLDLLRDGELHHLHFEDVPAEPIRELQGQPERRFPGEGIVPLRRIVEVLKRKKYMGPASLELFQAVTPALQNVDPYQMAMKARAAIEPLIA
jgi:2-keto-myo-inositol isomerase